MEGTNNLLDNIYKQIGDSGLIIQAKSIEFSTGNRISLSEIERLLMLFLNTDIFFNNELIKMKFISVLLHLQAEYDEEKAVVFLAKLEQWQNNSKNQLRNNINLDHLHIIFNLIEFENRFRMMNSDKLKFLKMQLNLFEKLEKPFEEYVLFKYYNGILSYHLKDYHTAKMSSMDIVVDFSEEIQKKSVWLEYIEIKNSLLNLKILEQENDNKEFLNTLETSFETYSKKFIQVAVQIGFKMSDTNLAFYEYDKASLILTDVYKKIKKQFFFGNITNKFPDFIEILMNTISRVIYTNIMVSKTEECVRFIKKLEKLINLVREFDTKNIEAKESIICKYQFYLFIFKQICKVGIIDKTELHNSINNYRNRFKTQINSEEMIINIYAFNSSDVLAKNFFSKVNEYMFVIQNNKMSQVNYNSLFFSFYNQISILTKNIATDSNTKKQFEYVEKIKSCSKSIVEYVNKYIDSNYDIRYVCSYPYFKEVLIKIYLAYIFSYYFSKEYTKALDLIKDFELIKAKLNLSESAMIKHYAGIIKLKGDILFKLQEFALACDCYSQVVRIYEEVYNHSQGMALVLFNLGLCYLYMKDYTLAKKNLNLSKGKYELLNSINQNLYSDKYNALNHLLQSLSLIISSE